MGVVSPPAMTEGIASMRVSMFPGWSFILAAMVALGLSRASGAAVRAAVASHASGAIPVARTADGYLKLGFDLLASFPFSPPGFDAGADLNLQGRRAEAQIPDVVKGWHASKAVVTGFMLPIKSVAGRVTELMLTRQTVAAGNVNDPAMNEWVIVRIKAGVPPRTLLPVSFFGLLKVGPIYERGYMVGIYELEAERMIENGF